MLGLRFGKSYGTVQVQRIWYTEYHSRQNLDLDAVSVVLQMEIRIRYTITHTVRCDTKHFVYCFLNFASVYR
jgi:hypothetical protein